MGDDTAAPVAATATLGPYSSILLSVKVPIRRMHPMTFSPTPKTGALWIKKK
jgi:hypothetical protein